MQKSWLTSEFWEPSFHKADTLYSIHAFLILSRVDHTPWDGPVPKLEHEDDIYFLCEFRKVAQLLELSLSI